MSLRTRRLAAVSVAVVAPVALVRLGGHAGVHMARNLLVPGAGVVDHSALAGISLAAIAVAATVLWLRWGADWALVVVVAASMVLSAVLAGGGGHETPTAVGAPVARAAHEFPLVVLVVAALAWVRSVLGRTPGIGHLFARRHRSRRGVADLASLAPVDRCRAVAVRALAGDADDADRHAAGSGDVVRRARRVGLVARARVGGDPFRRDHAHARAARLLCGLADDTEARRVAADARAGALGVPCSEPTWIRPLDGTLAALALDRRGHHDAGISWARTLQRELSLHRGHRPAWWWTPLGLGAGHLPAWEHAAATALARAAGWIDGDDDWVALRRRALGASARGGDQRDDERLIAAARCWLALVTDTDAERIVRRPGVRRDPLACALDQLATRLRADPHALVAGHGRPDQDRPELDRSFVR